MTQFWNNKDLKIGWTRNPANDDVEDVFKDYEVTVAASDAPTEIIRTEYVTEPFWTYRQDDMINDLGPIDVREIIVSVRERDTWLRKSPPLTDTLINLTPDVPTFSLRPNFSSVDINIQPIENKDIAGYMVFRGDTAGFTASDANRVYKGPAPFYVDSGLDEDATYFYRVAAYDVFDDTVANLNVSGALTTTTSSVSGKVVDYNFVDLAFTPNNPATNFVSWTAGTALKTRGGTLTTFAIPAGSAQWTTGTLYLYFDEDTEEIETSTNLIVALGNARRIIVASYKGGTELVDGTNQVIMDGSKIIAGTIGANQLVTGSAVITGTAQIGTAVIDTANIRDLAVGETKIKDDAITTNKIFANAITSNKVAANAITADKINANAVTADKIAANAVTADKVAANAITAGKIAANAVTTGNIQAGAITAASGIIADLAVTTLKIAGDAVTIPRYAWTPDSEAWAWPDDDIWRGITGLSITREGRPTMLQFGAKVYSNSVTFRETGPRREWDWQKGEYVTVISAQTITVNTSVFEWRLRRGATWSDGPTISPIYTFNVGTNPQTWNMTFVDMNLGVGTNVYTLEGRIRSGSNTGGVVQQRYMTAHQFKR